MAIGLTYIGHATTLVELAGTRVLTDPMLRERVGHLRRHSERVDPRSIGRVDAVLISHAHHDHLDVPTLRLLDRKLPLIVAPGVGRLVERLGFTQITELDPGERTETGSLELIATTAQHGGRRGLLGPRAQAVGFVLAGGGMRAYFAGDTDLFDAMSELAPLDLALVPVWGWGSRLGRGHLDPERAARALALLRPRVAVPIHWGTLFPIGLGRLRSHLLHEPPRAFARHAERSAPGVEVRIVEPGGSTTVGALSR